MSLTVVITPFTVTVATAVLDEDQLKFPLPPVACRRKKESSHASEWHLFSGKSSHECYGRVWIRVKARKPYRKCHMSDTLYHSWTRNPCILKENNYLYCVLISSDPGLPWKCQNTGTKNYGVIDFYILFIVHWVGEWVDSSILKKEQRPHETIWLALFKWKKGAEG